MSDDAVKSTAQFDKLSELYKRAFTGENVAVDVTKLASDFGANVSLDVKLFPGTDKTPVVGCVIDPGTGQCINYFTVPDPNGHILAAILVHGLAGTK